MFRPQVSLALALSLASCGGGGTGKPGPPAQTQCDPADRSAASPGDLEAELTLSLRQNAGLEALFGDRTQAILDEADSLRADAAGEAATKAGLPEPSDDALRVGGICMTQQQSGLSVPAWAFRELAMAHAAASLPEVIDEIPFSGTMEGVGTRANETGDPTVTATYNAFYEGDGKSSATVEVRGVVDITSPTLGSLHEDNLARATMDVCPDENGNANGKVHFNFGGIATPPGGDPWTYAASTDSNFHFVVDDDAEIRQLVIESDMTYGSTGAGATHVAGHGSIEFTGSNVTSIALDWDQQDGPLETVGLVRREIYDAALMVAIISRDKARHQWKSGTCVEVKTDREGGSVDAGKQISLTATAHHKFEQRDLDVPIQGWLEGSASLSPDALRVPSPATFQYTAGADGQMGTVHLESVSKRGYGKKDLVFTASGSGWSGQIMWTITGSQETSDDHYTKTWTGNGSGKILVRPGPSGFGEVDSASSTYTYEYDETYQNSYTAGGCSHVVSQTRQESLTGTATMGAFVAITEDGGGGFFITAAMPNGTTMGQVQLQGSESVTGPPQSCKSPADTDTTDPSSGVIPTAPIYINVMSSPPDSLSGTTTVHADGQPPLDFEISYSLAR